MVLKQEKTDKKIYILIFALTAIIKIIFQMQTVNYGINPDRIGDLAAPTTLAGLDWTSLISQVGYYGYGFKWIYFIFFKISDNPYHIYWAITCMYIVLMSVISVMIYIIMDKYLYVQQKWFSISMAIYMGAIGTCDMKSESSLYLATWIIAFLVVKACTLTTEKSRGIMACLLAAFLSYAVTLHERMVAAIIGFALFLILFRIKKKRWIVPPAIYYPVQILLWWGENILSNRYRTLFWGSSQVKNGSAFTGVVGANSLYFLDSLRGFKIAVSSAISNIFTLGTQTLGIGWIAICIFIFSILFMGKKKVVIAELREKESENKEEGLYALIWYFGICAAIVIAGLVVIGRNIYRGNLYGYKTFIYWRYYINFVYPIIVATLVWILRYKVNLKMIITCWIMGLVGVVAFLTKIYPTLEYAYQEYTATWNTSSTSLPWVLYCEFRKGYDIKYNLYINLIIIAIVLLMSSLIMQGKKIVKYLIAILFVIMLYAQTNGFAFTKPTVQLSGDCYKQTYEFVQQLEEQGILDEKTYIYTEDAPWTLQYMLPGYCVQWGYPEQGENVIISQVNPSDVLQTYSEIENYYVYQIAENQFFYTNSNEIKEKIEEFERSQLFTTTEYIGINIGFSQKMNECTVVIPGVSQHKLVFINDLHIISPDEEIGEKYKELVNTRYSEMMVDENGIPSVDHWKEMVDNINTQNPELVIMAGDMVDYASEANYKELETGMEKIRHPIMYIRSDHDYSLHYTSEALDKNTVKKMSQKIDGDPEIWKYDLGDVLIVGISNSWLPISDEALTQIKGIFTEGKPVVLVTHVPYDSLIDDSFRERCFENREKYNMWGKDDRYIPDDNMSEFLEMIYEEDSPVKAVLAAHLHYQDEVVLNGDIKQYVFAPSYQNNIGIVNIVGDDAAGI